MEILNGSSVSRGKEIAYTLFKQDGAAVGLAIVLPGLGYTAQAPLLHFATGIYFDAGYDVLQVNYKYSRDEMKALSGVEFSGDVRAVLDYVLSESTYTEFSIIGKSIGTIALSYLLKDDRFKSARAIWLTPLLDSDHVFDVMSSSGHDGLVVIGDEDPIFIEERFSELQKLPHLNCHLIEGTEHSLQLKGDAIGSIDVLKDVMKLVDGFCRKEI
ncbi:hypothetical protein A8F94_08915 [Bacillus sp. FJAT-27225]|uniref:hypothetical protein n=1 Tax=Bacillus sp. FJAT-27225 TaxID=1743144 RepID=UPI00080C33A2|nr:hypothetical protein [Bacillus sp. FJAT-27225]OCA87938.1 hypothetical protein A8F94_08915 [Bacillus sp. FJAT-27225]